MNTSPANDKQYPCLTEVCELLDLTVLTDITEVGAEEHKPTCPTRDNSATVGIWFECTCPPVLVYAIGQTQELAAGLTGGPATPWFKSMDALESFCERHLIRIRAILHKQEETDDYEWVDMLDWK